MVYKRLLYSLVSVFLLWSCSKADFPYADDAQGNPDVADFAEYSAIVTVKQNSAGSVFFQLDDDTRLFPTNYSQPYNGMQRIMCGLREYRQNRCDILWMDFLEKGELVEAAAWNGESDGADILSDWMTSVEDGFLTVHYSAWWGEGDVEHTLRLVSGKNPDNPYELWFCHDSNGDTSSGKGDALVYFDINSLPSTGGDYVILTLKWQNCAGELATKNFRFRSRQ